MRLKIVVATSFFVLSAICAAQSMEMRQKDADDFRDGFLSTLPDSIAKSDFLSVNPAGNALEAVFDFSRLLAGVDPQTFAMTGLSPWSLFVTPQDNGTAKVDAQGSVDGTAKAKAHDGTPVDVRYKISSLIMKGLLGVSDAKLDISTKDVDYLFNSSNSRSDFRADSIDYSADLVTKSRDQRHWDIRGSSTLAGVHHRASQPDGASVEISAAKIYRNYGWTDVPKKEFTNLASFIFARLGETLVNDDVARDDKIKSYPADSEEFRRLLVASFPLLSTLSDFAYAKNVAVLSPVGILTAGDLGYQIILQGKSDAMQLSLQASANAMQIDSSMIPASYSALLPNSFDIEVNLDGLDFASAGNVMLTAPLLTKADTEEMGEKTVDSLMDKASIAVRELKLKSSIYDLSMLGEVHQVDDKISQVFFTVWAYNFDRSIAAVQELVKTKPDLNSLNLWMMMAKGAAKTDTEDGSLRWTVVLDSDGSATVNGQLFKGPNNPAQKN